jgi:hypothetical protein
VPGATPKLRSYPGGRERTVAVVACRRIHRSALPTRSREYLQFEGATASCTVNPYETEVLGERRLSVARRLPAGHRDRRRRTCSPRRGRGPPEGGRQAARSRGCAKVLWLQEGIANEGGAPARFGEDGGPVGGDVACACASNPCAWNVWRGVLMQDVGKSTSSRRCWSTILGRSLSHVRRRRMGDWVLRFAQASPIRWPGQSLVAYMKRPKVTSRRSCRFRPSEDGRRSGWSATTRSESGRDPAPGPRQHRGGGTRVADPVVRSPRCGRRVRLRE